MSRVFEDQDRSNHGANVKTVRHYISIHLLCPHLCYNPSNSLLSMLVIGSTGNNIFWIYEDVKPHNFCRTVQDRKKIKQGGMWWSAVMVSQPVS